MTCVDVHHLWCGGGGACSWWREAAGCLLDKAGNGDAEVLVDVVSVGGVGPFDVGELAEV